MNSILNQTKEKLNKNVLITNEHDVYYLTRFRSTNLRLLLVNGNWYGLTDPRYLENAIKSIPEVKVLNSSVPGWFDKIKEENDFDELYINGNDFSVNEFNAFEKALTEKGVTLKAFDYGYIRDVFPPEDIDALERSSKLNDEIFMSIAKRIKVGMTEKEVRAMILKEIADSEASDPSFDPIVGAGPSGSNPHWEASDRKIGANEMLTIDMGVFLDGFASDMTRTFVVEGEISEEEQKIWDIVKEAMESSIELVKPGATCKELHQHSIDIIDKYGYKDNFMHSLGHGVGVDIHEGVGISIKSDQVIKEGMVITIEPGIYIPGKYGVRLEQAVLVTKDGYKVLNHAPVELYINK